MKRRKYVPAPDDAAVIQWSPRVILGMDPSMACAGWSVVKVNRGVRPQVLAYGDYRTSPTGDMSMRSFLRRGKELHLMTRGLLASLVESYDVTSAAIELPVPTQRGTGSQAGSLAVAAMLYAVEEMDVTYHHPNTVKKVVSGSGTSTKAEVKASVFDWLGRSLRCNTDVSDSIAVALTRAISESSPPL